LQRGQKRKAGVDRSRSPEMVLYIDNYNMG
jgi:hypothetical protein